MLKVGDVILGFNVVLFLVAMSVLGVEPALYSILTYVAAARTLEFILHGIEEYTAITIMSAAPQPIRAAIIDEMGRGVTVYKARRRQVGRRPRDPLLRRHAAGDRPGACASSRHPIRPPSSSSIRWPTSAAAWSIAPRCPEFIATDHTDHADLLYGATVSRIGSRSDGPPDTTAPILTASRSD